MDHETYQELIGQGVMLMTAEKYDKAKEYFEKAVALEPDQKEGYIHLGNANASLDLFDEALDSFQQAVQLDPDDAELYFSIGNVYILKGDALHCIENFNQAEEKGYKTEELYTNLAAVYMSEEEHMQAVRALNKAIKLAPMRADLRIQKAKMYIVGERYEEALDTLEELHRIFPDAFEAYDLRTQIYLGQKKYDKALEVISDGVARFEADVALRWIKIKVLVEMGKDAQAKKEVEEVRKLPEYDLVARDVLIQEAVLYANENNVPETIRALEDAVALETDGEVDGQCRFMLLSVYYNQKDYTNAMKQAEKLAALENESLFWVSGKYYIAQIHKTTGETEMAEKEFRELAVTFRKISIKEPTFYEIYMYRLLCHKELGEYEKALELADYMETLFPDQADAYAFRSQIYLDMGRTEEAEAEKKKARERNPDMVF